MIYEIRHRTTYDYESTVSLCHNEARLTPRTSSGQRRLESAIEVAPLPAFRGQHSDFFGNLVDYFAVQEPHESLSIEYTSRVEVFDTVKESKGDDIAWDAFLEQLSSRTYDAVPEVSQFTLQSPHISPGADLLEFALPSFPAGRPLAEAGHDLMHRIHEEFSFVSGFTTVSTPLARVLEHRRGVCQDFAQLGIGCLRSLGLPARYVSGYIETLPPAGQERLVGADASHAWFSLFHPNRGWLDFDPTNDQRPSGKHIVLSYGRDFSDISPLKGVMLGSGGHELDVAVDVVPVS